MRLLISKEIVGVKDLGLPTEERHVHAEPGDVVKVVFDNTLCGIKGHFICEKDGDTFPVFISQYEKVIKERPIRDIDEEPLSSEEYDLLYPDKRTLEKTELFE